MIAITKSSDVCLNPGDAVVQPHTVQEKTPDPGLGTAMLWLGPRLVFLFLYWPGLVSWFYLDDFAWLALSARTHSWDDLWTALFTPMAQGTVRTLSERAFFLSFYTVFGIDALPFRACVFAFQLVNLTLLEKVVGRLGGSAIAASIAATLYVANGALAEPLVWTSAFNQILFCTCMLISFLSLDLSLTAGRKIYGVLHWVAFLASFLVLESAIAYPIVACSYVLFRARRRFRSSLLLFLPSTAFVIVHSLLIPKAPTGPYVFRFGVNLLADLWSYWRLAVAPPVEVSAMQNASFLLIYAIAAALLSLSMAFYRWRRGDYAYFFLMVWFAAFLGPVLPLSDHVSYYYLTVPVSGLAVFTGLAVEHMAARSKLVAAALFLLLVGHISLTTPVAYAATRYYQNRSLAGRELYLGILRAKQLHPGKSVLLTRVRDDLFWAGLVHSPQNIFGGPRALLDPLTTHSIVARPSLARVEDYTFPYEALRAPDAVSRVVVYDVSNTEWRDVTTDFMALFAAAGPESVAPMLDFGSELYSPLLGPEWYPVEQGFRWMPRRATLRIGNPKTARPKLYLHGLYPRTNTRPDGALDVSINGFRATRIAMSALNETYIAVVEIPESLVDKPIFDVTLEFNRVFMPPDSRDQRELGGAFVRMEIK